jgi:hypothetical protein
MLVPVFGELAGKNYRLCVVAVQGDSISNFKVNLSKRPTHVLLNANHDVLSAKDEVTAAKL